MNSRRKQKERSLRSELEMLRAHHDNDQRIISQLNEQLLTVTIERDALSAQLALQPGLATADELPVYPV